MAEAILVPNSDDNTPFHKTPSTPNSGLHHPHYF
uniref:Uncharacterized protein n=1 Tax=Anguilla anguilla TaxID=7936 RepID=A0A0E9TIQ7_ANGAN